MTTVTIDRTALANLCEIAVLFRHLSHEMDALRRCIDDPASLEATLEHGFAALGLSYGPGPLPITKPTVDGAVFAIHDDARMAEQLEPFTGDLAPSPRLQHALRAAERYAAYTDAVAQLRRHLIPRLQDRLNRAVLEGDVANPPMNKSLRTPDEWIAAYVRDLGGEMAVQWQWANVQLMNHGLRLTGLRAKKSPTGDELWLVPVVVAEITEDPII